MRSFIRKRKTFKKKRVGESNITMFEMCTEIRESISVWRSISNSITTMNLHLREENIRLTADIQWYLRLVIQVHQTILANLDPDARLYSFVYRTIEQQFLELEPNAVSLDTRLNLFQSHKNAYHREWTRPVLNRCYNFRTMSYGELENLLEKFRQGRQIATELAEEIRNLNEEWEGMKTQTNSLIRDCIRRTEDLLSRVEQQQGIGEE